jgi:hypothetical protein
MRMESWVTVMGLSPWQNGRGGKNSNSIIERGFTILSNPAGRQAFPAGFFSGQVLEAGFFICHL